MAIEATICLIRKDGRLLLQRKAPGRFGGGKWDAPGGKLRPDESPEQCVAREIEEETGLRMTAPSLRGGFQVYFGDSAEPDWIVHVYVGTDYSGHLRGGPEGQLEWFEEDHLPYDQMWPSDRCWLPDLLEGRLDGRFEATFWFDENADKLLNHHLTLVEPP